MRSISGKRLIVGIGALLLMCSGSSHANEWEWNITPYLWAPSVGMDLTVADQSLGGEADFTDLIDKVDSVFMGHFEGRKDRWGFYLDTIYMKLKDNNTVAVGPGGPILGDLTANAALKMKIYDMGAMVRVNDSESDVRVDILGGLRYVDMDIETIIGLPGPQQGQVDIQAGPSETDMMLGARAMGNFNERWHWGVRGDVSYLGTDGTFNALAAVGYTFGQSGLFSLDLGYRYMTIKLDGSTDRGAPISSKVTMSGPVLGFAFNF